MAVDFKYVPFLSGALMINIHDVSSGWRWSDASASVPGYPRQGMNASDLTIACPSIECSGWRPVDNSRDHGRTHFGRHGRPGSHPH